MLKGKKIYLEAIEPEDLEILRQWRNNPEFRKYFREHCEINSEMQKRWFENKVLNDNFIIMFSIKFVENKELIGCCGLCYINWIHRNSDLSLYIGWNESYIDTEGYAKEASELLIDYGFGQLGLKKIWTELYEFDFLKLRLFEDLGFKTDGILRKQYYYNGKWWNSHILSLLAEDYK